MLEVHGERDLWDAGEQPGLCRAKTAVVHQEACAAEHVPQVWRSLKNADSGVGPDPPYVGRAFSEERGNLRREVAQHLGKRAAVRMRSGHR